MTYQGGPRQATVTLLLWGREERLLHASNALVWARGGPQAQMQSGKALAICPWSSTQPAAPSCTGSSWSACGIDALGCSNAPRCSHL
ncbi:hypothetical protein [Pseudomonas sp. Fl5BN2]|uniref:hypothetical protein n=1 Tax=Pseudomonas sp. Fl5BN2 TaxID=2697652 RepID=UPI002114FC61|nr:hypothetical protein [Pseudomonas sp. Fl5BN2]